MREKFNSSIKFCAIRTVPAAETKSIGLSADAQLSWFLQTLPRLFFRDIKRPFTCRDLAKTHASFEYFGTLKANSSIGHLKPIRTKLNIDYQQIN